MTETVLRVNLPIDAGCISDHMSSTDDGASAIVIPEIKYCHLKLKIELRLNLSWLSDTLVDITLHLVFLTLYHNDVIT
jgi:hypothetical protein